MKVHELAELPVPDEIRDLKRGLREGLSIPMDAKMDLAEEIVGRYTKRTRQARPGVLHRVFKGDPCHRFAEVALEPRQAVDLHRAQGGVAGEEHLESKRSSPRGR